jgi:signal transduction histidine kinase
MRSIRTQLVLWLVGGIIALTIAAGAGLYRYMEDVLEEGLDGSLAAKAETIAAAVHLDEGQAQLRWGDTSLSTSPHHEGPFYFQIWRNDGSTLARFVPPEMGDAPLPRVTRPHRRFQDVRLGDRSTTRITELSFQPRLDEDENDPHATTKAVGRYIVVIAHDRRSIDVPLAILMTGLVVTAAVVSVGIGLIVSWGVRRGLRPLAEVSALADRIGPNSMEVRFPGPDRLPPELAPIGLKLNELLDRLSAAFVRERRFSAAVAHELRTPLAELRSACDVALRWPDDAASLSTALSEARDVAVQMTNMVRSLLALARGQAGVDALASAEPISLANAVEAVLAQISNPILSTESSVQNSVDPSAIIHADPTLLNAVLRNLLENAVDYTPSGGSISVRSVRNGDGHWSLHIANTSVDLTPADIPHLFEPFWRKDPSRTGTHHAGLGLSLVQAYCEAMNVAVDAKINAHDQLELSLSFVAGPGLSS